MKHTPPGFLRSVLLGVSCALVSFHTYAQAPIRLEAEDGALVGVEVSDTAAGHSGSGYVTGFEEDEDHVAWKTEVDGGFYNVRIGYRTPDGEKGFTMTLGGVTHSEVFPANNQFAVYRLGRYRLDAGSHTIKIGGGWRFYEIDYVELEPTTAPKPPLPVAAVPVDPNATKETKELMRRLARTYGSRTVSGQQAIYELVFVEEITGKRPAILSGDLVDYSPSRVEHGNAPMGYTESLIEQCRKDGHILTLLWHWNAPTNLYETEENPWWSGFYTRATGFDIKAALANPEGTEYPLLLRDIDVIAAELRKVQEAGIPVLWRPLHEAEGEWFWWGARGPEAFKKLWRLLFERLTKHHGIQNLIWVLSGEKEDWYPGDDVVDIIGVDAYPEDVADPLVGRWTPLLERFNGKKLIALAEFGGAPDVDGMHALGVQWVYFVSWEDKHGPYGPGIMDKDDLKRIYTSDKVITLDEL